jgi:hypothetical protein
MKGGLMKNWAYSSAGLKEAPAQIKNGVDF